MSKLSLGQGQSGTDLRFKMTTEGNCGRLSNDPPKYPHFKLQFICCLTWQKGILRHNYIKDLQMRR